MTTRVNKDSQVHITYSTGTTATTDTCVVAPSYHTILYLLEHFEILKLHVITQTESVAEFCRRCGVSHILVPRATDLSLKGLRYYRRRLMDIATHYQGKTVFFFFHRYALTELFLISQLHKRNRVCFRNLDPIARRVSDVSRFVTDPGVRRVLFRKFVLTMVFKTCLTTFFDGRHYSLGIRPHILAQRYQSVPAEIESADFFGANQALVSRAYDISNYDVIYVDNLSALVPDALAPVADLLQRLQRSGLSVAVKEHPTWQLSNHFRGFPAIDRTLPAELLYHFVNCAVLGGASSSLIPLAQRGTRVISVLDAIDIRRDAWLREVRRTRVSHEIDLPKTIDQTFRLIIEQSRRS